MRADFQQILKPDFEEVESDSLFKKYSRKLGPGSYRAAHVDSTGLPEYPLRAFIKDTLYTNHILTLLHSENRFQRKMACLIIPAVGDSAQMPRLLEMLHSEQDQDVYYFAGIALLKLNTRETDLLFDFIINNNGPWYKYELYSKLDPDLLRETAYRKINSPDRTTKRLAAMLLGETGTSRKTENVLKTAVKTWDTRDKEFAISSLHHLQTGHLAKVLVPLLEVPSLRRESLEVLLNSPTKHDRKVARSWTSHQNNIDKEVMDVYLRSAKPENVRFGLELLRKGKASDDYSFYFGNQSLLRSDAFLPEIQDIFPYLKTPELIQGFCTLLHGRSDEKSVRIFISLLHDPNPQIRYSTAEAGSKSKSALLAREIPLLLADSSLQTPSLVYVAVYNQLDTLNHLFEGIYWSKGNSWKTAAMVYFSNFPKPEYVDIFRTELNTGNRRYAAMGLARLKLPVSEQMILDACRKDTAMGCDKASDYLDALACLKTENARLEVEKIQGCEFEFIRKQASEILANW